MTWTYLFCLIAGGVLITLSIAGEADGDLGAAPDIAEGGHAAVLFSTSFWSFGLAGFGLCGLLLQLFQGSTSSVFTLPLALLLGAGLGWAAAAALRFLARRDANTVVQADDLIGVEAVVTLPLTQTERGFVELSVRGSLLRRAARSASRPLARGDRAVILRCDGNTLIVDSLEMAD
jgi:membrane protein implicated in regulation of membrane protease activity